MKCGSEESVYIFVLTQGDQLNCVISNIYKLLLVPR